MKNWKTTVAGIITGSIVILQTIDSTLQSGTSINWYQIGIGFAIMVLGVVAKDFNITIIAPIFIMPLLNGCASPQIGIVSATLSNGDQFPLCMEVSEKTLVGVKLLVVFCANAQQEIDAKAAEYRKIYPYATITEHMGKETRKL
jgi:hypothetical protein